MANAFIEIQLTRGQVAIIDVDDYELVQSMGPWHAHKGRKEGSWWARCGHWDKATKKVQFTFMHALIFGEARVDHRNLDGLDNRRDNLRSATVSQNSANKRLRVDNKAGLKGVHRATSGRWRAAAGGSPKRHLGTFDTAEEAGRAYDAAVKALYGEFALLNFPEVDLPLAHDIG